MSFVLNVHGSADESCDPALLDRALALVVSLVDGILSAGGGVVVFLAREPRHPLNGAPLVFDWFAAERAYQYCLEHEVRETRITVVMGRESPERRFESDRRALFEEMVQHPAVAVVTVPETNYTGGVFRKHIADSAHAVVAIGGRDGVASFYREQGQRLAFLAVDAILGESNASSLLHAEALVEPARFFKAVPQRLPGRLRGLSLRDASDDPAHVAKAALALLVEEVVPSYARITGRRNHDAFVTALEADLDAAVRDLESNRHHVQRYEGGEHRKDGEESLRSRLLTFLKAKGYDATAESDEAGHTDLLVRGPDGLLWIAECKVHGGYDDLVQGMLQLHTRYASGRYPCVAFLIFCFNEDVKAVVETWSARLERDRTCGMTAPPTADPDQPLSFVTVHLHAGSGLEVRTRHVMAALHWRPEDKSGVRSRGGA